MHYSSLKGHAWSMEILNKSSSVRCHGLLRMQKHVLFRLCHALKERGLLKDSRLVSMEGVAMFLMTVGHNLRNFFIQDSFQHSRETISGYFHSILHAPVVFSKETVKPSSFEETLPKC